MRMGRAYGRASDHGTAAAAGPSQRRAATVPAITAYPVSLAWMSPSWHIQVQAQIVATLVGTGPPSAGTVTGVVTVLWKAAATSATSAPTVAAEPARIALSAAWSATDCWASACPAAPVR